MGMAAMHAAGQQAGVPAGVPSSWVFFWAAAPVQVMRLGEPAGSEPEAISARSKLLKAGPLDATVHFAHYCLLGMTAFACDVHPTSPASTVCIYAALYFIPTLICSALLLVSLLVVFPFFWSSGKFCLRFYTMCNSGKQLCPSDFWPALTGPKVTGQLKSAALGLAALF